jgi:hypothetical protein
LFVVEDVVLVLPVSVVIELVDGFELVVDELVLVCV